MTLFTWCISLVLTWITYIISMYKEMPITWYLALMSIITLVLMVINLDKLKLKYEQNLLTAKKYYSLFFGIMSLTLPLTGNIFLFHLFTGAERGKPIDQTSFIAHILVGIGFTVVIVGTNILYELYERKKESNEKN
ncbi:hypothetical protein [Aerococcus sp. UMB7834]|uniref:hypothetical protein n=1 Tax=Aerococcus sp. UMB7834 TaxID=3046342 RepID=UPI0025518147|nr:hypothetical protein [Aerococcus sp. UMB7834]MDK6805697.1 hypothetical protein [Aerococcus sp. UMB7834]